MIIQASLSRTTFAEPSTILRLGKLAGGNPPRLVVKGLRMSGFNRDQAAVVRYFPFHLLAGIQEVGEFGHGVPAKSSFSFQASGLLHPTIHLIVVWQNSGRMEVHQPHCAVITGKVGDGRKPVLDFGIGVSFGTHLLETRSLDPDAGWGTPRRCGLRVRHRDNPASGPCRYRR